MKPILMAQLAAAPLASLLLLLSFCAVLLQQRAPTGYRVPTLSLDAARPQSFCGSDRIIVVSLKNNGELLLNQDRTTLETITPTLRSIMDHRTHPGLYIYVDDDVPYAQFATLIDKISASTNGIQIGVLTAGLRHGTCNDQLLPS